MNTITYEERARVYAQATQAYGQDMQITVAIEEMSELIKELCKLKRLQGKLVNLAEEIADVTIMMEQLRSIFNVNELVCAFMDAKVQRLAANLSTEEKE